MKRLIGSSLINALASGDSRSLSGWLRLALGGRRVALCLHRVAARRRPGELLPGLTIAPEELDALLSFLVDAVADARRLTVSFDDGYRDSAEYLLSRAPRFPQVEWLYFVCPEKVERQVGFRWDLAEVQQVSWPGLDPDSVIFASLDRARENTRSELSRLAADPRFRLADVDLCREVQRLPNAALGNHTNVHHPAARFTAGEWQAEVEASLRDFERLFGRPMHFAFPFGQPEDDFSAEHLEPVRRAGRPLIWSTEPRPFHAHERRAGAVLPRYAVDGTRTWRQTAAQIALRGLRWRVFGGAGRYPLPA